MRTKKFISFLAASAVVLFNACMDEDDFNLDRLSETTLNPTIEANLLSMDFTAQDFLDDISDTADGIEVLVQPDSTLMLRITSDFDVFGDDLGTSYFNTTVDLEQYDFKINDITLPNLPVAFTDDLVVVDNETVTIPIPPFAKADDDEVSRAIDSVLLNSGALNIVLESQVPYDAEVVLKSADIKNSEDNSQFNETFTVSASQTQLNKSFDLTNHKLNFNEKSGSDSSYLYFTYSIKVMTKGKMITAGDYGFGIKIGGDNMNIEVAWGQVGNPTVPVSDIANITYFEDSTTSIANLGIKDIIMKVNVTNYTGIKPTIDLSRMHTVDKNGTKVNLFTPGTVQVIDAASMPYQSKVTSFTLHPITAAVAKLPDQFVYDLDVIMGNGTDKAFIRPAFKYLDVHSVIDIPVVTSVTDFISKKETDALDFLQDDDGVGDYIDSVILKLNLDNTFPAELNLQLYTLNENGVESQLLSDDIIVESANVDANGKVIASKKQNKEVSINQTKYQQLRDAQKIIFKISFNTPTLNGTQPAVIFRSDSKLSVKLGVKAHGKISF